MGGSVYYYTLQRLAPPVVIVWHYDYMWFLFRHQVLIREGAGDCGYTAEQKDAQYIL